MSALVDVSERTNVPEEPGRIRVVLCTDGVFPEALGGMQRHSRLLAEHLARTGRVELTVLHPHAGRLFDPGLGINEVRISAIDTERFYLAELWRYSQRVASVLRSMKADVILSQGFCVWSGIGQFGDRLIIHPHGLEMFQAIGLKERLITMPFRWVLRYMVRRSRFTISLGGRLTNILENLAAGSGSTVVNIPNAVEVPVPQVPYRPGGTPLRLLFVGRFAYNKGLDILMAVAQRLVENGQGEAVRFELAGDGPLLAHYKAAGLPENVALLGRVDDDRLFQLYTECDALVLPTRFEGMPTVVLEAMARSRPIIVSDVGATAELVDAQNGALVPKGDAGALHAAIMDFLAMGREQRERLGNTSWERAQRRFDWQAVTTEFVSLFQRVQGR